jgi:hypothetical protein
VIVLSAAGWSWGYCSAVIKNEWRWIVDAHGHGKRYIVHSDEPLSAFLELEAIDSAVAFFPSEV